MRPAIRPALTLACGILAADVTGLAPSMYLVLLAPAALAAFFLRRRLPSASDAALLLMLSFAGMWWSAQTLSDRAARRPGPSEPRASASFFAHLLDPPVRSGTSWITRADLTTTKGSVIPAVGFTARLQIPLSCFVDPDTVLRAGERWSLDGMIMPFPRPKNPGEFDYGAYLSASGIDAVVRATRVHGREGETAVNVPAIRGVVQEWLYGAVDHLHTDERAAFLKGVILGYRAELSEDLKQAFLATGTVHILAVSGGNVALIAGVAMVLAGAFRGRRRTVAFFGCVAVVGYMWVTGSSPSVVRATVMALIVLGASMLGRRTDVYQSLSVAALFLLVADPRTLFDPGFQLSFLSVLAIVVGSPMIERILDRSPEEFRDQPIVRATVQLMGVSLAAQVGTLPLTVGMFGSISVIAVLTNLAVVPLSGASLVIGVVELLIAPINAWCAGVFAAVNDQIMDLTLGLVRLAAQVPWSSVDVGQPDPWIVWVAYAGLGVAITGSVPRLRSLCIVAGLVMANAGLWFGPMVAGSPETEVVTLDVGQGDAHLIRSATGRVVLIDAGPTPFASERAIVPMLRRWGVDTLDLLIVTHPHRDHDGGVDRLLDHVPVRTLAVGDDEELRPAIRVKVLKRGGTVVTARRGDRLEPDRSMRLYVLHPGPERVDRSANNRSVVVRLLSGSSSMLLTGDMELEGERLVAQRYGSFVRSHVLKVAHHGSSTGTTDAWLSAVGPESAVISAGWGNSFGHPDPQVVVSLRKRDIQIATTKDDGAIWWRRIENGWTRVRW